MSQPVILHVEDDSDDAFFVAYAFEGGLPGCIIRHVKDGREAIDFLDRTGEFATPVGNPGPDLVLLDLKLPDVNGFEVLQWIRSQARFKSLYVLVLSGSSVEKDRERARQLGANAYFVKTPKYADVVEFVAGLLKNPKSGPTLAEGKIAELPIADSTAEPQAPS
jgi:DNA-binding response OmpR family regulator